MSSDEDQVPSSDAYDVGYRRPPREHRFKPGRSGNPKGRPKKSQNVGTILRRDLLRTYSVRDGDRYRRLTKLEIMIQGLVNKAAKSDIRSLTLLLPLLDREGMMSSEASNVQELSDDEEKILQDFKAGFQGVKMAGSLDETD